MNFIFSEVHRSVNAIGLVQIKWRPKGSRPTAFILRYFDEPHKNEIYFLNEFR